MALEMQNWNASLQSKEALFEAIAKKISGALRKFFLPRVYIAIVDAVGKIHHIDTPAFDEFLYFIPNFVKDNFHLLDVGDYSIPLGGTNLAFFKISEKAMIILHTKKGRSGQLLSYKQIMFDWVEKIDELIGEIEKKPALDQVQPELKKKPDFKKEPEPQKKPVETPGKNLIRVPLLIKPLSGKEKLPLEVTNILQYCDGIYSIEEIVELTKYPRLKVDLIIREYHKKKWIKLMRIV